MNLSDTDDGTVWSRGDKCLVKWAEDYKYYEARIVKFITTDTGEKQALVNFQGFTDEDNELVHLNKLKKIKQNSPHNDGDVLCLGDTSPGTHVHSMFSPLTGSEEHKRLSEKFSIIDKEEKLSLKNDFDKTKIATKNMKRNTENPKDETKRKKDVVAIGGQATSKSSTGEISDFTQQLNLAEMGGKRNKVKPVIKERIHTGLTSSESEDDLEPTGQVPGFSELDLERPYFPHVTPCSPKQPFLLSQPGEVPVVQVPATMNQYLRDYQRAGIKFLYKHFTASQGAILADDMGLGKTVQVIGFLSALLGKTGTKVDVMKNKPEFIRQMSKNAALYRTVESCGVQRRPFLVIGPASVIYNWLEEFQTWGHFTVGKFHRNFKEATVAELRKNKLDLVVTTYETCRDHVEVINEFTWEAVIADEAHKIKGMKAEVTQALKTLHCRRRYGLTGTPLQNNLAEFWCILDWANTNCLGDLKTFKNNVCKILERGQRQDATKRQLAEARCVQEQLAKVKDKWMLRRTKLIIQDQLPRKEELVVYCKMAELQSEIYQTILAQEDMHYILTQREPCTCGRDATRGACCFKWTPGGHSVKALTFTYMHLLLKAANHVALLLPRHIQSEKQIKYAKKICEEVFEAHPEFLEQNKEACFRTLSDPKYCGKMKVLTGLLSVFRKRKSKILIFSYSTRLLNILEQYVIGKGYEYRRLDGDTPHSKRLTVIREFNKDPSVFLFLVSTKAGGVGLNLTGANVVIIFDPNWNPIHDLQAQDRAYRLGQVRDVKVYRLICSGTIEENIYLRQVYKQQKANVAVEAENARRYFHKGELFGIENMFRINNTDRCLTEDILKRNKNVEEGLKMFRIEEYVPPSIENVEENMNDEQGKAGDGSEGLNKEDSPVKKAGTVRSTRAKPIVYASESDSAGEDTDLPFARFISKTVNQIKNNNDKPQALVSNSQEASTSKAHLSRHQHSQALKEELDDLWDSFNTVKDDCSKSETQSETNAITSENMNKAKNVLTNGKYESNQSADYCKPCQNGSRMTISKHRTKRKSSDSGNSDLDSVSHDTKCTETKRLKLKSFGGKGVKGKSKQQIKEAIISGRGRINALKKNVRIGNNEDHTKSRPDRNVIRFHREEVKENCVDGFGVHTKMDVSGVLNATFESVSDVLDQCGVVHTHQNQRIIGSSKAEDHMTRCAIQDVYELHQHTQAPAMLCDPFTQSSEESDDLGLSLKKHKKSKKSKRENTVASDADSDDEKTSVQNKNSRRKVGRKKKKDQVNEARVETMGGRKVLIGQTPKGIRKQQFTFLSHSFGMDPTSLAKQIVYSTPVERVQLLRQFYVKQEPDLNEVLETMQSMIEPQVDEHQDHETVDAGNYGKKSGKRMKKRRPTKKKSVGRVKHCGRKTSSTAGVHYTERSDTDSPLTDTQADAMEHSTKTLKEPSASRCDLMQPTLEGGDNDSVSSSSDSESKTALNVSSKTNHNVKQCPSSGSDTELEAAEISGTGSVDSGTGWEPSDKTGQGVTRSGSNCFDTDVESSEVPGYSSLTESREHKESDVKKSHKSGRSDTSFSDDAKNSEIFEGSLKHAQNFEGNAKSNDCSSKGNFDYLDELFF